MPRTTDVLSDWAETSQPGGARHLTLRCSNDVAGQVERAFGDQLGRRLPLRESDHGEWTHRCPLRRSLSTTQIDFLDLLRRVVTLRLGPPLLAAVALDWYQDPDSNEDPNLWAKTRLGNLLHDAKYRADQASGKALARELRRFTAAHPDFVSAEVIVAVPSHSEAHFSERLARALGLVSGLPVIVAEELGEDRTQVKGRAKDERTEQTFSVDATAVAGRRVLVLDDMVRSGGTIRAVAEAVMGAGATSACGLAAARTMRN